MLNDRLIKWLSREQPPRSSGNTAWRSVSLSTDIGLVREQNQDRVACMRLCSHAGGAKPFVAIALSDGMGGMKDGAECAVRTVAAFFDSLIRNRMLDEFSRISLATKDANEAVYAFAGGYGGATLSAVLVSESDVITVNVGDSRIYADEGLEFDSLKRLTVDDSLAEIVGGNGRELLQFIGMGESLKVKASSIFDALRNVFLTTDGIHFVNQDTLSAVFSRAPDLNAAVSRINNIVRWSGAPDNATLAAFSLSQLRAFISERADAGVEFWDPFGDFYFSWVATEDNQSQSTSVGADRVKDLGSNDTLSNDIEKIINTKSESSSVVGTKKSLPESSALENPSKLARIEELKSKIAKIQDEGNVPVREQEEDNEKPPNSESPKKKFPSGVKRVTRTRRKAQPKNKKDMESLQIVIEMDSNHREDSDEGSGKV